MAEILFKELTGQIIGVYYDVYNNTSRTYPEFVYEKAMMRDIRQAGTLCQHQEEYRIFYKDQLSVGMDFSNSRAERSIISYICSKPSGPP